MVIVLLLANAMQMQPSYAALAVVSLLIAEVSNWRGHLLAVLSVFGVHLCVTLGHAFTLLIGQFDFVRGIAQHH